MPISFGNRQDGKLIIWRDEIQAIPSWTIRHLKEINAFSEISKVIQGNSTNTTFKNYDHQMH